MADKNETVEEMIREMRELLREKVNLEKIRALSVLTIKEVQSILPFTEHQLRYYAASGVIPCKRLGRHYIFSAEKINAWAKSDEFDKLLSLKVRASRKVISHKQKGGQDE